MTPEPQLRQAAFNWLHEQVDLYGDVLPRKLLEDGFYFNNERITLVGPQGIWKPKMFSIPLSITTVISGPYRDSFSNDGYLLYKYRGTDPRHPDNMGLCEAMKKQIPLIYFNNVVKGRYHAVWPVYIVGDDPAALTFKVAVDDEKYLLDAEDSVYVEIGDSAAEIARRSYITTQTKQRLHQRSFREKVLLAYHEQCALCRLRHRELLDAAHIIPDRDPEGEPVVRNGLSLCKLHHAAFDKYFLTVNPDYYVEIRKDILEEEDGPMLLHGLQGLHEKKIVVPHGKDLQPDKTLLEKRYHDFRKEG